MLRVGVGSNAWKAGYLIRISAMENQTTKKVLAHYEHNDSCKFSRWTTRESYQFMFARPWVQISDFYSRLINGHLSLYCLFDVERSVSTETTIQKCDEILKTCEEMEPWNELTNRKVGRWARVTYKIVLSYHGGSFDGWQKQPGLNTVQGLIEKALGCFVDEIKAQKLKEKSLPMEGCAVVAGRTDKGVTALQQVCSFYTWRNDVECGDIEDAINKSAPGKIRVLSVSKVSRDFHPNFSAKWRRYLYILPFGEKMEAQNLEEVASDDSEFCKHDDGLKNEYATEDDGWIPVDGYDEFDKRKKPSSFSVVKVNQLLQQLEGRCLSYKMFARDTKASRSSGPPTECFMYHARAAEAILPCAVKGQRGLRVMCVELIANRFLRKMVRVVVATAVREAAANAEADSLLKLMDATCRRATAPPAPPDGLCLVDVGYQEFNHKNCLIQ